MLNVVTWLWGDKYGIDDVRKLASGLRRHLTEEYRFLCVCDDAQKAAAIREFTDGVVLFAEDDEPLLKVRGCFARLRMFDPKWQSLIGALPDDRLVNVDLDVVITGPLDPLFYRPEPFLILLGANASNPCVMNGSIWMLRAGYRPDVWSEFSLDAAELVPYYQFPDDQAWMADKMRNFSGWNVGPQSGIYAFKKPMWPRTDDLPKDARIVVFPGWRSPSKFAHLPWVQEHWRV